MSSWPISARRSVRVSTTLSRSWPYRCLQRRRHPAGVAHRRQFLVDDQHDLGRQSRASRAPPYRTAARRAPCIDSVWLAKSSSARMRLGSKLPVTGRPDAPSRSSPPLLRTTSPLKNAASRRCTFSSASMTEKRGSAPRNTAASPQATFRSISSVESGLCLRQRRRDVDRDGRRADSPLGADEREDLAARRRCRGCPSAA